MYKMEWWGGSYYQKKTLGFVLGRVPFSQRKSRDHKPSLREDGEGARDSLSVMLTRKFLTDYDCVSGGG